MAKENTAILAAVQKFKDEPKKKGKPDWTLNSRNIMAVALFHHLQLPAPRGTKPESLPSMSADVLEKFDHPLAKLLIEYRSKAHALRSVEGAIKYIHPATDFGRNGGPSCSVLIFTPQGYDNVERIFTKAGVSIPLSADKRVRYAFLS